MTGGASGGYGLQDGTSLDWSDEPEGGETGPSIVPFRVDPDELYRKYLPLCRKWLRRAGIKCPQSADDIIQAALAGVILEHTSHREPGHVEALVKLHVRHRLVDHLRATNTRHEKPATDCEAADLINFAEASAEEDEREYDSDISRQITKVMGRLRKKDKEIIQHCYLNGLPLAEYAANKGIKRQTAEERLALAMREARWIAGVA